MNAPSFLIAVAPLLLLLVSIALNRYPGEAVIERLRGMLDAGGMRAPRRCGARVSFVDDDFFSRRGDLMARSLAGRAPPVPA